MPNSLNSKSRVKNKYTGKDEHQDEDKHTETLKSTNQLPKINAYLHHLFVMTYFDIFAIELNNDLFIYHNWLNICKYIDRKQKDWEKEKIEIWDKKLNISNKNSIYYLRTENNDSFLEWHSQNSISRYSKKCNRRVLYNENILIPLRYIIQINGYHVKYQWDFVKLRIVSQQVHRRVLQVVL